MTQEKGVKCRGKVKWFDAKKGYGFILRENEPDVFVHYSDIVGKGYRTLEEGQEVEYELRKVERGYQAFNVWKIS